MLIDGRTIESGSTVTGDVVVIGSGPAGYAVTRRLADAGQRVVILEAGGLRNDEFADRRSSVALASSHPRYSLAGTRRLQIGGLINAWEVHLPAAGGLPASADGVRHLPLDPLDLHARPEIDRVGWPIDYCELAQAYPSASDLLGAGPVDYAAEPYLNPQRTRLDIDHAAVRTRLFRFSSGEDLLVKLFGLVSGGEADLLHHATVTHLEEDETGRVRVAHVAVGDRRFTVQGTTFVLAAGGVENARLLLASRTRVATGLGNTHDQVGRNFMDHPLVRGGVLVPGSRHQLARAGLFDLFEADGHRVMGKLDLAPELMVSARLPNMSAILLPRPRYAHELGSMQWTGRADLTLSDRVRSLARAGRHPRSVLATRTGLRKGLFPDVSRSTGWSAASNRARWEAFEVIHQCEQLPDPANRVTLDWERDEYGSPKAHVTWTWSSADIESTRRGQRFFAEAFAHQGIWTYHLDQDGDGLPRLLGGTHHHLGATRMSARPEDGVVDSNGRVWGHDNLYVTGLSVFPTGGYANPTLTLVALAIRLGDHLAATGR